MKNDAYNSILMKYDSYLAISQKIPNSTIIIVFQYDNKNPRKKLHPKCLYLM